MLLCPFCELFCELCVLSGVLGGGTYTSPWNMRTSEGWADASACSFGVAVRWNVAILAPWAWRDSTVANPMPLPVPSDSSAETLTLVL